MSIVRLFIFCLVLLLSQTALAAKGTLLYVPMDNRPVCLDYTVKSMQAAGWDVQTPSEEFIANATNSGNTEEIFRWLEKEAETSTAIVVSSDALVYGGLVGSRTHELSWNTVKERVERLLALKQRFHGQKVYVFTTIMRSPKASSAPVEPAYYAQWGPKLFRLGALEDKLELKLLKHKELKELADLRRELPMEVSNDMYMRRRTNIRATELLLSGVESGDFDYMLIGRDDTATFSQAHREARSLDILVRELPKEKIRFFSGADQLGLLLLSRASTRLKYELPLVNVTYAAGKAGETIPSYEDDTVAESAKQHIYAAGAFPVSGRKRVDLVLAVNTPKDGVTLEASNEANNYTSTPEVVAFSHKVKRLADHKYPIALADIKYGNGSDNALVKQLFADNIAYELKAYGGWNTAGNALGFALAQGLMHRLYSEEDKNELLKVRYLDDWAYQANARMKVYQQTIWPQYWPNSGLKDKQLEVAQDEVTKEIQKVAEPVMGDVVKEYHFSLPWQRMFEVNVGKIELQ